ncbi:xanthine dehydrogenase family protein molybdopterin-binding subunit [Rhodovulum iodosum]|uniref:molybdopterin cofactor-binding domain-containing protein n=1 Tax=Rhodovulum iodosum TaxID=68291 RepID=UPI000F661136|nr:molybdopterin cofactor-binding domain-containing protein [Rhodovulum robiginosum]RSK34058.1 xanthine dehydrogenase family protein molybdopterin-binding subunit [Rhodovulum robiginosum]
MRLTPYVEIDGETITVIVPRAEMGQGVQTTLAALVAEEMDLDWGSFSVAHGAPSRSYANGALLVAGLPFAAYRETRLTRWAAGAMRVTGRLMGMQITGGSTSTRDAYLRMRRAGAAARAMLVAAAARRLGQPPETLRTQDGAVVAPDGTRLPYAALAAAAAKQRPPRRPRLKPSRDWRLLGRALPRPDMADKVHGRTRYAGDIRAEGMLFATVRMCPHFGGTLRGVDAGPALAIPGVVKVVEIGAGVGVIARDTWTAMRAARALAPDWGPASGPADTDAAFGAIAAAFDRRPTVTLGRRGDVEAALGAEKPIEAEYRVPYLAHATMEPMTATALYGDGRLTLWAGTQAPLLARERAARAVGLKPRDVTLHVTPMGGGFGRRAEFDFSDQAARLARAVPGRPVCLAWSRAEDMSHDFYRPAMIARLRGQAGASGPAALSLDIAGPSVLAEQARRVVGYVPPGPDKMLLEGAFDQPYAIADFRARGYRADIGIPVGSWRSVGYSHNTFFLESFLDEIAAAAGLDPVEMRLNLMRGESARAAKVLERAAEIAGWGTPPPPGHARGVAFCWSFGAPTAQVVEICRTEAGIRLERLCCAMDVGRALDPGIVEAQIVSGALFGLSAAIYGEITLAGGAVEQANFDSSRELRLGQLPAIETCILQSGGKPAGVGEPATPPAAPALANALFALTGERHRRLPLHHAVRFA